MTSASILVAATTGRLSARVVPIGRLDAQTIDEMWALFAVHYDNVSRPRFDRDLRGKTSVILAADSGDGTVRGFSTVQIFRTQFGGRPIVAIYSGDTIIDPRYWGQRTLQRAFLRVLMLTKARAPLTPVYWFLISKGYKTYLLLARNFQQFWPRHGETTPAREVEIIHALATERFGEAYLRQTGVVRSGGDTDRVRQGLAPITAQLLDDADIRFFTERNPGHAGGDELCCLGRFDAITCWKAVGKLFMNRRR